jgi:hypothetical protein
MERAKKRTDHAAWRSRRDRARLECRECEVICERVVSPWHCLKSGCAYVYAYDDAETTYFGCLHKVFGPELDLAAFVEVGGRAVRGIDPYGLLRVIRSPKSQCEITIEQAYPWHSGTGGCCNPTFFHHPTARVDEGIRLITNRLPDREPDSGE